MISNNTPIDFKYIESLLKKHKQIRGEIRILRLELETLKDDPKDAIEGVVLSRDLLSPPPSASGRSDKTYTAAMGYRKEMDRTKEGLIELQKLLNYNELELKKLDIAVENLVELQKKIIKGLYYQNLKWRQVRKRYYISDETINNNRIKAIECIVKAFKKENLLRGGNK